MASDLANRDIQEAHEKRLDLSAHDPSCVGQLIAYMYTLDYDGGKNNEQYTDVRLYALAHQLGISSLMLLALGKFKQALNAWSVKFIKEHDTLVTETIRIAYDGPSSNMGGALVNKLVSCCMLSKEVVISLLDLIEEEPDFGKDMVEKLAVVLFHAKPGKSSDEKRYQCPSMGDWYNATFTAKPGEDAEEVTCYACATTFPKSRWEVNAEPD